MDSDKITGKRVSMSHSDWLSDSKDEINVPMALSVFRDGRVSDSTPTMHTFIRGTKLVPHSNQCRTDAGKVQAYIDSFALGFATTTARNNGLRFPPKKLLHHETVTENRYAAVFRDKCH